MPKQFLKDSLGWGFILWFIGYVLSIVLFMVAPAYLIGYILTPVGAALSLLVLWKKIKGQNLIYFFYVGLVWLGLAVILDYFLIVKLFNPADGYYKWDIYVYYSLTILLPLIVGWWKTKKENVKTAKH
jgi:hypothetical protein